MKRFALIVAGGSGSRLKSDIPKQFLELAGKPILMHSVDKFNGLAEDILVVLPEDSFTLWNSLCEKHKFTVNHVLVPGGNSRAGSVKNGLDSIKEEGIVAIHDAVRPLVSRDLLERLYNMADEKGSAIPVIPVKDSMRKVNGAHTVSVDRAEFMYVQTPQCFSVHHLKEAYRKNDFHSYTDEASLAEAAGYTIHVTEGELKNVKITFQEDLLFAESVLRMGL